MKPLKFAALFTSVVLALSACGGGDIRDALGLSDAQVRFVHAVPTPVGRNLTLSRNNQDITGATNVPYQTASSFRDVDDGRADWRLRATGSTNEYDKISVDIERSDRYTFIAIPATDGMHLLNIHDPDARSILPTAGFARLRVVNASPTGRSFDVFMTSSDTDINDVSPVLRDTPYREARPRSGDGALSLISRNYRVRLTETGSRNVLFDADVDLASGSDRLLVAVPAPEGDNKLRVLVVGMNNHDDSEPVKELTSR